MLLHKEVYGSLCRLGSSRAKRQLSAEGLRKVYRHGPRLNIRKYFVTSELLRRLGHPISELGQVRWCEVSGWEAEHRWMVG
jgi:hypothetical protein